MILVLDYRQGRARVGTVSARSVRWVQASASLGATRALAKAFQAFRLDRRRPQAVAVFFASEMKSGPAARNIRQANPPQPPVGWRRGVAVRQEVGSGGPRRMNHEHVSWSTVRATVATANTLAFAWNVPVFAVTRRANDDETTLVTKVRRGAATAKLGHWVQAVYDGEPNITMSKRSR